MPALILLALLSAAPAAPNSAQCDAEPFTLNKPAAKPAAEPPKKAETPSKTVEAKPKPRPKPLSDCKEPVKTG
jgi:hypothetical protein